MEDTAGPLPAKVSLILPIRQRTGMPGPSLLARRVGRSLRPLPQIARGVVVAVSGGPDSVALALAVAEARLPGPLVIAHVNHQLRGSNSDADEDFVAGLAQSLVAQGAPVQTRAARIEVATLAQSEKANLEAVARRERYRWLADVASQASIAWVVTGHTLDDQAETVLHHLLRGAGLRGLCGIARRRRLADGVDLARPLLAATRAEVLAYLHEHGQTYREDATNKDLRLTRNRIRHELLPLLAQQYNPGVVRALGRLAAQAETASVAAQRQASRLLEAAERPRAGELVVLDQAVLAAAGPAQARELFRLVWDREGWPSGAMGFDSWDRLAAVACGGPLGVDLPGGLRARRRGGVVQLGSATAFLRPGSQPG